MDEQTAYQYARTWMYDGGRHLPGSFEEIMWPLTLTLREHLPDEGTVAPVKPARRPESDDAISHMHSDLLVLGEGSAMLLAAYSRDREVVVSVEMARYEHFLGPMATDTREWGEEMHERVWRFPRMHGQPAWEFVTEGYVRSTKPDHLILADLRARLGWPATDS